MGFYRGLDLDVVLAGDGIRDIDVVGGDCARFTHYFDPGRSTLLERASLNGVRSDINGELETILLLVQHMVISWMNGSQPAQVRAIHIAEEHGWLPLHTDDDLFPTFNRLVAWVYSRGSIPEAEYAPTFACHEASERERLAELFETLGVKYTIYREETTAKGTEAHISEHSTIIGRLLVLLGAPLGPRTRTTTLPDYLTSPAEATTPATDTYDSCEHARTFAETYLANTARYWSWNDGFVVRHEDRSPDYLQALARVLADASGSDRIDVHSDSLFLPTQLIENLCPQLTDEHQSGNRDERTEL